jgi:hypothetical protein
MVNRLTLAPGASPVHGIYFWEPRVDGAPMRDRLAYADPDEVAADVNGIGPVLGHIPVFAHNSPVGLPDEVLMLRGALTPSLPNGRVPIYVCSLCWDIGCGVVSAEVQRTATTVVWRDFGWEDSFEHSELPYPVRGGPFVFDRTEYEAEMLRFVTTFDELRASLPPWPGPGGEGRRPRRRFSLFRRPN